MQIQYKLQLTEQELDDLLITAIEGGINYWAEVLSYHKDESGWQTAKIIDHDGEFTEYHTINHDTIRLGVDRLCASKYEWHVTDLVNDNADATTADVIVQLAIFDEIVYG